MTHTPGPWDVSKDATPEWHYQATVSDENGDRVATAFVSEDNARLIAAAPDLLETLSELVDNGFSDSELATRYGQTVDRIRKAREAIDKAVAS